MSSTTINHDQYVRLELRGVQIDAEKQVKKYDALISGIEYDGDMVGSDLHVTYIKVRNDWELRVSHLDEKMAYLTNDTL